MVLYKYSNHLHEAASDEFDKIFDPGDRVGWSGIYRCINCGHEAVHTNEKPLPPQNHHQHRPSQGRIQWKLIVTDSAPPS